jgi:DNA mismatch repair protein MutS2
MRNARNDRRRSPSVPFSSAILRLLAGDSAGRDLGDPTELDDVELPDLLWHRPAADADPGRLLDLLDLAFLGRASAGELDAALNDMPTGSSRWDPVHFAEDLFLAELVRTVLIPETARSEETAHARFLLRVLTHPPSDVADIRFRQGILGELETDPDLARAAEAQARHLRRLLSLLRASRDDARLEPVRFRLDVLRAFRRAVATADEAFASASSGLRRVHDVAAAVRSSHAFGRLEALLDHHEAMASLRLEAIVGSDGRLRHLEITELAERRRNPFFRRPLRRWWDRLRIVYHSYRLGADELVDRLVMGVYHEIAPAMARTIQTLCHLEVYLAARNLTSKARAHGLEVCLPEIDGDHLLELEDLFNPLLMTVTDRPVPSDLVADTHSPITLLTGPNSGGKTRLLQAIGIAQVLGQSGLFVPCKKARMPLVNGLFASIVEVDRADQAEGRLGTEMMRLRTLFENAPPRSLVLLDELCSGTNPSEAVEIIEMVLRMLRRIGPIAFVTTHFLDFAKQLTADAPVDELRFLQVEVEPERGATFRFVPGVAATSLAVGTARRLGLTFEELERKLTGRSGEKDPDDRGQ